MFSFGFSSHADTVTYPLKMMNQSTGIRNVVFDLGGVLLEWNPRQIVARAFEDPAVARRVLDQVFQDPDWLEFDAGNMSEPKAIRFFAGKTGLGEPAIRRLFEVYRDGLAPIPESVAFFDAVHRMGLRRYCISNIHHTIFTDLARRHPFLRDFNGVVTSGRVGILKPDLRIYEHLLTTYALEPSATVFFDDRTDNVQAAVNAGIHGVLFTGAETARQCLQRLINAVREDAS